jgi:SSS family solute:Na+ symporter
MKGLGSVLYEYLQNVQSLIAPAIAAVFLMGVFNRKITPKAGEWGLLMGFLIGMFRLFLMVFRTHIPPESILGLFLGLNWLLFCVYLFGFTILLMVVISFFTPKATIEQLQGLTYFSQSKEQRAETRSSWSSWDILTSLVVVGLCVAFYIYFW